MLTNYKILCVISGCGGGDWPPLLALAERCHKNGNSVFVVCDKSTTESVAAAHLHGMCLPDSLDFSYFFDPAMERLFSGQVRFAKSEENPFVIWANRSIAFIVGTLQKWRPDIIITSLFGLGLGDLLARRFSVPRCFLNPSFNFDHRDGRFRYSDFSKPGGQMYQHWLLPLVRSADLILHATDSCFDHVVEKLPQNHFYVGPLFWEESIGQWERFAETGPPWVLITLSTSPQPGDLAIVTAALQALEAWDVRVLVTLAPKHDLEWLDDIPANVYLTRYFPHSQVLPGCLLVISHAGHGSVMKAMGYGVPMVLVPWGRDQPGVASRAQRLGVATVVPRDQCYGERLATAIKQVMEEPQFKENAQNLAEYLGKSDGLAVAMDYLASYLSDTQ